MAYIAGDPLLTVSRFTWEGAATAGQTSIGIPGGYTPGMVDVFVGGAALSGIISGVVTDFDDSDGMTIKLSQPMAANTQYRVNCFAPGSVVPSQQNSVQKTGDTMTGQLTVPSLKFADGSVQTTAPLSNRNVIVDGNFDNWITTNVPLTSAATHNAATMYIVSSGVGGACNVAQSIAALGAEPVGMTTPLRNLLLINQTTGSTGTIAGGSAGYITQGIEDVRTLSGRSATFSCWLQGAAGMVVPFVLCRQVFGTGGSPSANIIADKAVNWVMTGGLYRYSVRLDIPSLSGKTLGTNNDHYLQFGLWLPPGVVFGLYMGQWQLEQSSPNSSSDINGNGGSPTPFEYRGPALELARVQRQYFSTALNANDPVSTGQAGSTSYAYCTYKWPVNMRSIPAMAAPGGMYRIGGETVGAPIFDGTGVTGCVFHVAWSATAFIVGNAVLLLAGGGATQPCLIADSRF